MKNGCPRCLHRSMVCMYTEGITEGGSDAGKSGSGKRRQTGGTVPLLT